MLTYISGGETNIPVIAVRMQGDDNILTHEKKVRQKLFLHIFNSDSRSGFKKQHGRSHKLQCLVCI